MKKASLNKMRLAGLFILLLNCCLAYGADPGIQERYNKIKTMPDDTNKIIALGQLNNDLQGNDPVLSKEIVDAQVNLALHLKIPRFIIRARLAKAHYYGNMNMFKDEMDELMVALKLADDNRLYLLKARGLIDMGIVYKLSDVPAKAIACYREALAIQEQYPELAQVWILLMNIGNFYDEQHQYDSAFIMYDKSYVMAEKYKDSSIMAYVLSNKALTYYDRIEWRDAGKIKADGEAYDWAKAKEYRDKANALGKYLDYGIRMQLARLNARVLLHENKIHEAIEQGEQMKQEALHNKTYDFASYAADLLATAYLKDHNYVQAVENARQCSAYEDTVLTIRKQQELMDLQAKYETEKKDIEIVSLKTIKLRDNIIKVGLGIILILVVATAFSTISRIRNRRRSDLEMYEKNKRLLEAEKQIADDNYKAAMMELEFNHKQLDTYTRAIIDKNMVLEELKNDIDKLQNKSNAFNEENQLSQISSLIDQKLLTEDHWIDFKKKFENIYRGFFNKLREISPDITNAELRLCCLIKLNLTSREMASMLGISEESVYKARYRLRKKLMLEHDEELMEALNKI